MIGLFYCMYRTCRAAFGKAPIHQVSESDLLAHFRSLHPIQGCTLLGMSKLIMAQTLPPGNTAEQSGDQIADISVGSAATNFYVPETRGGHRHLQIGRMHDIDLISEPPHAHSPQIYVPKVWESVWPVG